MLKTYPISHARRDLTSVIHEVENGQEVELTRHGRPVARLVPTEPTPNPNGLWAAIEKFRADAGLEPLNLDEA